MRCHCFAVIFILLRADLVLPGLVVIGFLGAYMRMQTENTFKDVFPELQLISDEISQWFLSLEKTTKILSQSAIHSQQSGTSRVYLLVT